MASTTFVNAVSLSDADWFNDVNRVIYTILGDPADAYALFKVGVVRSYAEYTVNGGFTSAIPADNTIPQITEGGEILSVAITPTNASARIRIRFQGTGSSNTVSNGSIVYALFKSGVSNALAAGAQTVASAGEVEHMGLEHEEVAGSTSARTYSIRIGPALGGQTVHVNGGTGTTLFGGVEKCTLVVEQVPV